MISCCSDQRAYHQGWTVGSAQCGDDSGTGRPEEDAARVGEENHGTTGEVGSEDRCKTGMLRSELVILRATFRIKNASFKFWRGCSELDFLSLLGIWANRI